MSAQVHPSEAKGQPYVGLEHIDSGNSALQRWGDPGEVRSAKNQFGPEDILYGKLRPYLDKAVIAPFGGICSTDILVLRAKPERAVSEFLASSFHTKPFVAHAVSTTAGVNHPRTSWAALKTFGIAAPPLPEQRAIAAVLRTVQRAKEACEQVLAATRQLKASRLHHLFTYGPVPFAQADRVELQETEIGPAPSSWPTKRFDDFVTLQRGQDLRREDFEDGTVPVIGATSIIGFHREANVKGPGVTVVRSGSSAGKPLFINRDFWAHNVVLYVKDFHGNDVKFVYHKLGMLDLTRFRAGVAVPTLNRNTFSGIMVDVSPLSEQREIARQLAAVDAKLVALEMRRAALASLFASLLHHLMTGQVRLPAAMRAGAAQGGLPEFPNAKAPRRAVTPEAPA